MELLDWLNLRLSQILDFPVPQDLTEYILAIENTRDLEDYLKTLLNFSNPKHRQFFEELLQKRQPGTKSGSSDVQGYKKSDVEQVYFQPKQDKKKKNKGSTQNDISTITRESPKEHEEKKKKSKFINMYSQEGRMKDFVLLKGRHRCDCQATKHKLIGNCLECGRIVCEQEGSGPCFFCDTMVCTEEEKQLMASSSKEGNELYKKLTNQEKFNFDEAVERRNRLLEFDRTSEKRTRVIDDESDYYGTNSVWLSPAERQKLKKEEEEDHARRHASRLEKKFTLDFAGRKVLEEDEMSILDRDNLSLEGEVDYDTYSSGNVSQKYDNNLHPRMMCAKPVFQEPEELIMAVSGARLSGTGREERPGLGLVSRVQDRGFLEMSDGGVCLSMHQPWASLLIAGVKQHEGRVWYHSHRGRLWIAATAKPPAPEDIKHTEHMYRVLKNEDLKIPTHYPIACLLGCVSVTDCLPQEEYRSRYPNGESDSPFVFICEEPRELPVKFPIHGKHKIYKLDKKIHEAAQKALERVMRAKADLARIYTDTVL